MQKKSIKLLKKNKLNYLRKNELNYQELTKIDDDEWIKVNRSILYYLLASYRMKSVNDTIGMYKKRKITMYKIVHEN